MVTGSAAGHYVAAFYNENKTKHKIYSISHQQLLNTASGDKTSCKYLRTSCTTVLVFTD